MCLMEKMCSGVSCNVVSCEFNATGSTIRYIQKKEEEIHQSVCEVAPQRTMVTSIVCDEIVENMEKWLNLWIHETELRVF